MVWLILGAVLVLLLAKPLVGAYRGSVPTIVASWDAADRPTAFDADLRAHLSAEDFVDAGAHHIQLSGFDAVMHL